MKKKYKYISKFRRFGGEPFLDSTDFIGLDKNGKFWSVEKNGTRTNISCDLYTPEWAERNWEKFD